MPEMPKTLAKMSLRLEDIFIQYQSMYDALVTVRSENEKLLAENDDLKKKLKDIKEEDIVDDCKKD